jgi:predicted metal-binding protein
MADAAATTEADVTVFVCITCNGPDAGSEPRGRLLFNTVMARLPAVRPVAIAVTPIACLAVCKRPCTIALAARGKWSCLVGDLDPTLHADDVINAALSHAAAANGIIPWRQRPQSFRKGVVARIPPLGFRPEEPESDRS